MWHYQNCKIFLSYRPLAPCHKTLINIKVCLWFVYYLDFSDIVHRDLKLENILLSEPDSEDNPINIKVRSSLENVSRPYHWYMIIINHHQLLLITINHHLYNHHHCGRHHYHWYLIIINHHQSLLITINHHLNDHLQDHPHHPPPCTG